MGRAAPVNECTRTRACRPRRVFVTARGPPLPCRVPCEVPGSPTSCRAHPRPLTPIQREVPASPTRCRLGAPPLTPTEREVPASPTRCRVGAPPLTPIQREVPASPTRCRLRRPNPAPHTPTRHLMRSGRQTISNSVPVRGSPSRSRAGSQLHIRKPPSPSSLVLQDAQGVRQTSPTPSRPTTCSPGQGTP